VFAVQDIVDEVTAVCDRYPANTVRTYIASYLTSGSYGQRGSSPALERVSRGNYRRRVESGLAGSASFHSSPAGDPSGQESRQVDTSGLGFERFARTVLSDRWAVELDPQVVELRGGVTHSFDLVAPDQSILGDAKYYKDLKPVPAAKLATISEYVWLLQQHPTARRRFLVFGNDPSVPNRWLKRFAPLLHGVEIWFLDGARLDRLA
jgi:hypothetical protein